ncbi:MAG: preprotein translocase subunit SecG [Candidatus Rhabdochlamydia sp.]|jgi:preprotein translocase subunit SecG|nr:preprotein translocase subunit SecG [Chlamydiota bacterium]
MTFVFYLVIFLFILLCALLCLVVLVQESKSLGLGASFGGDPGDSLFGTSTADVLKKFTAYLGIVFIISCVVLSLWTGALSRKNSLNPTVIEEVQH